MPYACRVNSSASFGAWLVASLALLMVLSMGSVADAAKPSHKKAIWGPPSTDGKSNFPIYRDLGAGTYHTTVRWFDVAQSRPANPTDPNDPAYKWSPEIDQAVRDAANVRMQVAVTLIKTPPWANGGKEGNIPPRNARDFADFAEAAARRWPTVRFFQIWGEPIRSVNFFNAPTGAPNYYVKPGASPKAPPGFTLAQAAADRKYAQLVDGAYARLKKLNKRNRIIGGNTTTSGDVDPFNWVRFMKLPGGKPPRMDFFGHNPFSSRRPNLKNRQLVKGTADFSDLDVFYPWVRKHLSRKGRNAKLKLYLAEFTAPTDVESFEFPFFVTRKVQAEWLTAGLRITRRSDWIYSLGWIGLRDITRGDGTQTRTGLIDAEGRRKASYFAFRRG